jgi:hypothetical protein
VTLSAQESMLAAIGEAAARVLRRTDYEAVRADEIAAEVRVPSTGKGRGDRVQTRSTVWIYNATGNRRVWVALAAFHAWQQFLAKLDTGELISPNSTIDARMSLVHTMSRIAHFHEVERTLMRQVARGIGDISRTERQSSLLAPGRARSQHHPEWSSGPWGKVALGGWNCACVAFSDFLMPIIKSSPEAATYLDDKEIERQANLLSDLAFRAYTSNLEGSVERLPEALAAYWFEGRALPAGHAFISYVRENSAEVDRLQRVLEEAGVRVWRDTADLWPGEDWRAKIRQAIVDDALVFLACFSSKSIARKKGYQYEELHLAIDQMRLRRPDIPWLIPVRFDDCVIPNWDIGANRSLASIQRADLFGVRQDEEVSRLVAAVRRVLRLYAAFS